MSLVEVIDLVRDFGGTRAVDQVSFGFDAGQVFGFIGPNGAGKTTTMRIMAGLDQPTSGDCRIGGISTVEYPDRVYRRIGFMPDALGSYPNTTVGDTLEFFARAYGLRGDPMRAAIQDVVSFCQLDALMERQVAALSKGMTQRLGLARCLVHDPQVLLLDEPSAGLDPRARVEFRTLLRLLADQGKAVLISSHILADLEELCDAVAIVEQGRMVITGSVDAVARGIGDGRNELGGEVVLEAIVEIRLAGEVTRMREVLAEQPELSEIRVTGTIISARCVGGDGAQAAVLARLVAAGWPVCHFSAKRRNLEEAFMRLTEGAVQ